MVSAVQRGDDFVSGLTDMLGGGTYKLGVGIAPPRHVADGILAGVHSHVFGHHVRDAFRLGLIDAAMPTVFTFRQPLMRSMWAVSCRMVLASCLGLFCSLSMIRLLPSIVV